MWAPGQAGGRWTGRRRRDRRGGAPTGPRGGVAPRGAALITAAGFVAAAALGALARAEAGRRWNRHDGLPLGTLAVNVVGSFLLGLLWNVGPSTLTVLGVGGLGTFTTFSSFARDVVALVELRQVAAAAGYLLASCGAGIGAAAIGVALVT